MQGPRGLGSGLGHIPNHSVLNGLTVEPESYLTCVAVGASYLFAWMVSVLILFGLSNTIALGFVSGGTSWLQFSRLQGTLDYSLIIPPFVFGFIGSAVSLFLLDRRIRST
jgi:hypothetical protein